MIRICARLLSVVLLVVVQPYFADAAIETDDGDVQMVWTAEYIPFSWKFSVDPFPIRNGSLSWEYDPDRAGFQSASGTDDYFLMSSGENVGGMLQNIQFAARADDPPSTDSVDVFELDFVDIAQGRSPGPVFTIFAGDNDGFNFPVDGQGNILFHLEPEITPDMILPFTAIAPVPEPGSLALVSLGALSLFAFRQRHPSVRNV